MRYGADDLRDDFTCRSARKSDATSMALLHQSSLPLDPAALLGYEFLVDSLYPWILNQGGCSIVATAHDGKAIGFVVFSSGPMTAAPGLLSNLFRVIAFGASRRFSVIRSTMSVGYFLIRSWRRLPKGVELAWISVDSSWRGAGVGAALVESAFACLRDLGHSRVWVKTLDVTPRNVEFYVKSGFHIHSRYAGRVILVRPLVPNDL